MPKSQFFHINTFEIDLVKKGLKRAYLGGFGDYCSTLRTKEMALNKFRKDGFIAKRIHGNFFILSMSYEPIQEYLHNKRGRGRFGRGLALGRLLEFPVPISRRHATKPLTSFHLISNRKSGYSFAIPNFYLDRNREDIDKWLAKKLKAIQAFYPQTKWVEFKI